MTLVVVLFTALLLDMLLGDPPNRLHPVCLMGWWAHKVETTVYSRGSSRWYGAVAYVLMVGVPLALLFIGLNLLQGYPLVLISLSILFLWLFFAPKGLALHGRRVEDALIDDDIVEARRAVSMLVGRRTENLDSSAVARAAIESIAENLTDGILSPLFWFTVGWIIGGPIIAVILLLWYRLTNTLDSLWGHKNSRYRTFGTVSAKMDDALNYLPARLALFASALASGSQVVTTLRIGLRDGQKHESPNAAITEAAFAGALSLRLNGPVEYDNNKSCGVVDHPWLGDGTIEATAVDIDRSIILMWKSTLVFILLLITLVQGVSAIHRFILL